MAKPTMPLHHPRCQMSTFSLVLRPIRQISMAVAALGLVLMLGLQAPMGSLAQGTGQSL